MAGVITSGSNAKSLWPGVKSWFGTEYAEHPPEYSKIFKKDTDDKNYVEMVATTSFGLAPIKTEGGAVSYDSMRQFFVNLPREVEEAARIDGCSRLGVLAHVALPLARPALAQPGLDPVGDGALLARLARDPDQGLEQIGE